MYIGTNKIANYQNKYSRQSQRKEESGRQVGVFNLRREEFVREKDKNKYENKCKI